MDILNTELNTKVRRWYHFRTNNLEMDILPQCALWEYCFYYTFPSMAKFQNQTYSFGKGWRKAAKLDRPGKISEIFRFSRSHSSGCCLRSSHCWFANRRIRHFSVELTCRDIHACIIRNLLRQLVPLDWL